MQWHVAHRHEREEVVNAITRDYEGKAASLKSDNMNLRGQMYSLMNQMIQSLNLSVSQIETRIAAERRAEEARYERDVATWALIMSRALEENASQAQPKMSLNGNMKITRLTSQVSDGTG